MTLGTARLTDEPVFGTEEWGTDGLVERPFLSLSIPTYNRAPKLDRLLTQLQGMLAQLPDVCVEIVISNNASPDATRQVIAQHAPSLAAHAPVRVLTQSRNIGGDPNFHFIYQHSRGEYVWICSDDDVLDDNALLGLIDDLSRQRPEVCISSFVNFGSAADQVVLANGVQSELIVQVEDAVPYVFYLGKITQFVFRKHPLDASEVDAAELALRTTNFWFKTMSMMLLVRHQSRLLVRSAVIARSDREVMNVRFSPRVYDTIKEGVMIGLGDHPSAPYFRGTLPNSMYDTRLLIVAFLFRHTVGWITMDQSVARQDFRYLLQHLWPLARYSWRNAVKIPVILLMFPIANRISRRMISSKASPPA